MGGDPQGRPAPPQARPARSSTRPVSDAAHPHQPPTDLPADTCIRREQPPAPSCWTGHYRVDGQHGFEQVLVVSDGDKIIVTDLDGEILIEHTRPAPGVTYVGNGRPRGPRPKTDETSPKS